MAEVIEESRQGMVYVSRAVDQCEATFCSDLAKMRSEVQKEMAEEWSSMLVMMSSLAKLWKLFAAKGVCLDAAIGAVEAACDSGAEPRSNMELLAAGRATTPSSLTMRWGSVEVDDVGRDVVMADASAVFGDCAVEFDVIGECRSADVQQERDDTGGLGAPSWYVVQDAAVGSIGGAASVGEAMPCESGVDVGRPSVDGLGDGEVGGQDVGASLAFNISYGAVEEPAGEGGGLRRTDGGGADVGLQDRLSLILRHDSDDEESDDEAGDCRDADVCGLDQAQHRLMDWGRLCAYERMVFAGAAAWSGLA